jgi:hypothetical protein
MPQPFSKAKFASSQGETCFENKIADISLTTAPARGLATSALM